MKITHFLILITLTMFSIFPVNIYAGNNDEVYTVTLSKHTARKDAPDRDPDQEGQRIPSRPIVCYISNTDGISITGCEDEIITFELWDINGENCILSCVEEMDFLAILYSLTGEYTIKLSTHNHIYIGYISTVS